MKKSFLILVGLLAISTEAADLVNCVSPNYFPNGEGSGTWPKISTYIEKDSPTEVLYGHLLFQSAPGSHTQLAVPQALSLTDESYRVSFQGDLFELTVTTPEGSDKCGTNSYNARCVGKVEFVLPGETTKRSSELICFFTGK